MIFPLIHTDNLQNTISQTWEFKNRSRLLRNEKMFMIIIMTNRMRKQTEQKKIKGEIKKII